MIALVSRAALSAKSTALQSYSTSFPNAENPISESGKWTNGSINGNNHDVRTTAGLVFATQTVTGTDDNAAILNTSFHADQYIQLTAFRNGSYTPPDSHECEALLRFKLGASGIARGYEIDCIFGGNIQVVRWDNWSGGVLSFTVLADFTGGWGTPTTGDVLYASMVGSTITVKKNGTLVGTVTDTTYTDGQPGVGFFPRSGATLSSLGWSALAAGEL